MTALRGDGNGRLRASWQTVAKGFAALFVPLCAVVGAIVFGLYYIQTGANRTLLEAEEHNHVALLSRTISSDFRSVVADLMILSKDRALRRLLNEGGPAARRQLIEQFQILAEQKKLYDQVRYIDETGLEVVRVNLIDGKSVVVPQEELQLKADRYYLKETFGLNRGEVFVSPFDLNVEKGVIEQPLKPTIRFSTPVFDSNGTKRGIVVLNYLGANLIGKLEQVSVNAIGQIMLLNAAGYWLHAEQPEDEWGFMFDDRRDRTFARAYPEAWRVISRVDSAQFLTESGMFTCETVYPVPAVETGGSAGGTSPSDSPQAEGAPGAPGYRWEIVSRVSHDVLSAASRQLFLGLTRLFAVLTAGLAIVSWFLCRFRADHRLADRALQESEHRFRQMAENIDEVFWMTSTDRRQFFYVSPAYEQIFGRATEGLHNRPEDWLDAIHPDDRSHARDAFFHAGEAFDVEYRIVRPDGAVRWIWDHGFPVRDAQGTVQRMAGIAEDTTSLKKAQEQILQSERLSAIGEAMTGLAHESRNALQRSQACLERIVKRVRDRPEVLALTDRLQGAQRDLSLLYEKVRGYAAPIHLSRRICDMREILENAWSDLAPQRKGRESEFHADVAGMSLECAVDPFAMRQALRNILENALFVENDLPASPGRVVIDVTWSNTKLHGQTALSMSIRDNGPGLSQEQAERIFEPFYTTKSRGTGLGMAIAKRIVDAHGGEISVGHGSACGAVIVVALPRKEP